jgi:hypothetical protein
MTEKPAIGMTDEELERLRAEVKQARGVAFYDKMEGHAERAARYKALLEQLRVEETRRALLSGFNLVEQQLLIGRDNLEANRRMAEATEAAAHASSVAARAAERAAIWTAVAAIVAAIGTAITAWSGFGR